MTASGFNAVNPVLGKVHNVFFKGFMDEVKFFNYTRNAGQIRADYNAKSSSAGKGASVKIGAQTTDALSNGLVGYWKMDESSWNGTSGEVIDSSGRGVNGTAVNSASTTTAKYNKGGNFDGVSKYVNFTAISPTVDNFTVATWIYISGDGNLGYNGLISAGKFRLFIDNSTNYMHSQIGSSGSYNHTSTVSVSRNTWHHVVLTFDGSSRKYYLDGVMSESNSTYGSGAGWYNTLGTAQTNAYYLNGLLDEVRVYNRALSPAEISQLYNWAPGPVGYWKMEEKTGGNIYDSSGNSNTGGLTGSSSMPGKFGNGRYFTRTSYANVTDNDTLSAKNLTIGAWIKMSNMTSDLNFIISKVDDWTGSGTTKEYALWINTDGTIVFDLFDNCTTAAVRRSITTDTLTINRWYYISAVWDGTKQYTYIDGRLSKTTTPTATTLGNCTPNLHIGNGSALNHYSFDGIIDEAIIYNYARTAKQITEDMNAGHPIVGSPMGGALQYWKFDEGSGDTTYNSSTQGNSGDLGGAGNNCPNFTPDACPLWDQNGKISKALRFTKSLGAAYVDAGSLASSAEGTMTAWIRPGGTYTTPQAVFGGLASNGADVSARYFLGMINTAVGVCTSGDWYTNIANGSTNQFVCSGQVFNSTNFPANVWTHVAITYNDTEVKFYKDRRLVSTVARTANGAGGGSSQPFSIGRGGGYNGHYFDGAIDEAKIYNYVLTPSEINLD